MELINDFSQRSLAKQDIHLLRDMARYLGVASPTSKKKEQLIADILDIVYGKAMPQVKNLNRGRPAKNQVSYTSPSYQFGEFGMPKMQPGLQVASPGQSYQSDALSAPMRGVVVKQDGKYYIRKYRFVQSVGDVKLTEKQLKDNDLKVNDVVDYIKQDGKLLILSQNAVVEQALQVDQDIVPGKRNLVYVTCLQDKQIVLGKLAGYDQCLFLPSNSLNKFAGENLTIMPCDYSNDNELLNSFFACCDVASFYAGLNKSVVLVCDNILNIITALKQYDAQQSERLERQVLACIEKLVTSGITFVALMPQIIKNAAGNLSQLFDNIVNNV